MRPFPVFIDRNRLLIAELFNNSLARLKKIKTELDKFYLGYKW